MTDAEYDPPVRAPLPIATFVTSVARIELLDYPFTRVTFRGGDLVRFSPIGPDQFLYLLLPPPGQAALTIDSSFTWEQYRVMPESEQPVGAYYTVRHHRSELAEIDIDIVGHGHIGRVGAWLERARPGDPVALWGPRMVYSPPPGCRRLLLFGDETALPAIAAICESGPTVELITIIVELDPRTALRLSSDSRIKLARLDRSATGASRLTDTIRAQRLDDGTYVWGAGERELMRELRIYLRAEAGLRADQVAVVGYWQRNAQ